MIATTPSASHASQGSSELADDTAVEVVGEEKTTRQRCARCVRKELKCRADMATPGTKTCKNCTTAGTLCFFYDLDDETLCTALVDETSTDAYKALAKLHLDFLDNFWYNGELHTDAKRLDALARASSSGDKNAKTTNPREAVGYDLDASWFYDLFGQTRRFMTAVETFLEVSAAAKKPADAERAKAARRAITEQIKQLKFGFDEDEYEIEYEPKSTSLDNNESLATETPATPVTPAKNDKYEFKIDPDTAELMFSLYTRYLKLFNLLASGLERVMKQHGSSALIKVRGDEHEFLDQYASDDEAHEEPDVVNVKGKSKLTRQGKKNKAKKFIAKAKPKKTQAVPVDAVIGLVVNRGEEIHNAFEQAVEAMEQEHQGVKAVRVMDEKARDRWGRLVKKLS